MVLLCSFLCQFSYCVLLKWSNSPPSDMPNNFLFGASHLLSVTYANNIRNKIFLCSLVVNVAICDVWLMSSVWCSLRVRVPVLTFCFSCSLHGQTPLLTGCKNSTYPWKLLMEWNHLFWRMPICWSPWGGLKFHYVKYCSLMSSHLFSTYKILHGLNSRLSMFSLPFSHMDILDVFISLK